MKNSSNSVICIILCNQNNDGFLWVSSLISADLRWDDRNFFTKQEPHIIEQESHVSNNGNCLRWHVIALVRPPQDSHFQTPQLESLPPPRYFPSQEEMTSALATMRVDYDQVKIKDLDTSSNPLLIKRRKKAAAGAKSGSTVCQSQWGPADWRGRKKSTRILNLGMYFLLSEGTSAEAELDFSPAFGGDQQLCSSWAFGVFFFNYCCWINIIFVCM